MTITLFCFNFIGDGLRDASTRRTAEAMGAPIFQIRDLDVHFATPDGDVHAVKKLNLDVGEAECLGVVGESGSGKSQLFLATIGLLLRQRPRHGQA